MKKTLLFLTFIAISIHSKAATITFTGAGGGFVTGTDWNVAANWDSGTVPTASDVVILDGFAVTISIDAFAQSVSANSGADLTINAGVTLTITGSSADHALEITGTSGSIINNGTIIINGTIGQDAINSKGDFDNNGTIIIGTTTGIDGDGIYVSEGTFTNNSMIMVTNIEDSSAEYIRTDNNSTSGGVGTFVNTGTLTVAMTTGDYGIHVNDASFFNNSGTINISAAGTTCDDAVYIQNSGILTNLSGGIFNINSSADYGINTVTNGSLVNAGTITIGTIPDHQIFVHGTSSVTNSGTINLNNSTSSKNGLYLTDNGIFTNVSGGQLNVSGASNYGIQIDANNGTAEFVNNGTVTITGGSKDGLRIQEMGKFTNNATGVFNANNTGDAGIQIDDATPVSSIDNSGMINITNSTGHGMELFGTFNNLSGGTYKSTNAGDDGLRLRNTSVFNNDGAIVISGSLSEDIETDNCSLNNTANATYSPGSSPGILKIKDAFDFGSSTTTFEISGTAAGTGYDQITHGSSSSSVSVSGAKAHLDWGSFVPTVGDIFTILDASSAVSGTFTITSSNATIVYTEDYTSNVNEVRIEVTEILPVELASFEAESVSNGAQLTWATASETNNEGFEIERSNNSRVWRTIGYTKGSGNSNEPMQYTYLDNSPSIGVNYYRLKQNDFDGNSEYSNVIRLNYERQKKDISLFPNPVHDYLFIDQGQYLDDIEITIYDSTGKIILINRGAVDKLNFGNYDPGIYFVKTVASAQQSTHKIIHN